MRVFVGCSGKNQINKKYKDLASDVATTLAHRGHKLLFGGYDQGMMGSVFYTFKYENAKTKGIAHYKDADILKDLEVDASEVVNTTFERTKLLYQGCELIVILPGGVGTLSELFGMMHEIKSNYDDKKIILFDYEDFYKPLINYLNQLQDNLFISDNDFDNLYIVKNIEGLNEYLDLIEKEN